MGISAVVITFNEEDKIRGCLDSTGWVDEIILIDGGSTDGTVEIARNAGARVYQRRFDDFASQKNYGVEKAAGEWVLSIDADEIIPPPLRKK